MLFLNGRQLKYSEGNLIKSLKQTSEKIFKGDFTGYQFSALNYLFEETTSTFLAFV